MKKINIVLGIFVLMWLLSAVSAEYQMDGDDPSYVSASALKCSDDCSSKCKGNLVILKFNDHNQNGVRDCSTVFSWKKFKWVENCEKGIGGFKFTVTGPKNYSYAGYSDDKGFITIKNLPCGKYNVTEEPLEGWAVTTGNNPSQVKITACDSKKVKFGNVQVPVTTSTTIPQAPEYPVNAMPLAILLVAPAFGYLLVSKRKE